MGLNAQFLCGLCGLWVQVFSRTRYYHQSHPVRTRSFDLDFDFIDHRLVARTSDGQVRTMELRPRTDAASTRN